MAQVYFKVPNYRHTPRVCVQMIDSSHLPFIANFWQTQLQLIEHGELDFKNYSLPLARIKKVMKTDDDVKTMMISAEAPIVFAKACEIFILELTLRAWMHTDECKRRTLQRNDVAVAISRSDIFDFLIDIVPREDAKLKKPDFSTGMIGDPNAYFYGANPAAMNIPYPQLTGDPTALLYQQQQNFIQHQYPQATNEGESVDNLYPVVVEAQPAESE